VGGPLSTGGRAAVGSRSPAPIRRGELGSGGTALRRAPPPVSLSSRGHQSCARGRRVAWTEARPRGVGPARRGHAAEGVPALLGGARRAAGKNGWRSRGPGRVLHRNRTGARPGGQAVSAETAGVGVEEDGPAGACVSFRTSPTGRAPSHRLCAAKG